MEVRTAVATLFLGIYLCSPVAHGRGIVQNEHPDDADGPTKGNLLSVVTNVRSSVSEKVVIPVNHIRDTASPPFCPGVCLTAGCTKAAAIAEERLNKTADPCDDFFEFACGGFVEKNVIPDEKSSYSSFTVVHDKLQLKLRVLVEEEPRATDTYPTKMVKDLYSSCMNTSQVNRLGLKPLRKILRQMGGWPVVQGAKWSEAGFDWIQANYKNRERGYSIDNYFDFSVSTDVKNSLKRIIWLDQASLGMSREYLIKGINDSDVQHYLKYAVDTAVLLGADMATAKKEMTEALLFQIKLANISLPREERRNTTKLYNLYTLSELTNTVPIVPWVEYINTILPTKVRVDMNEVVGVSDINYFKNLTKIMQETPKRVLANYLMWRNVAGSISFLTEKIRKIQFAYSQALTGTKTRPPRWKECLGLVSGRLSYAVSSLFVKRHFDDSAKVKADEMVTYIRAEFRRVLAASSWMDPQTKLEAYKKADAITQYIAYPPELKDDAKLLEYYKLRKVDRHGLLDNILRLGEFGTSYAFGKLREPVDKKDWKRRGNVAMVNAFYSSLDNAISFPAGILDDIFFEEDRPNYMNFGAIGFVIGHEITHGFDDQGKQYNDVGNLQNWWDAKTEQEFLKKKECIIYQYGNYTAPENGLKLNGINTQGENIADNGGIKQAYRAYQEWVEEHEEEPRLPGLTEYSPNQVFWISAAQVWCSKYRSESLKLRILTGVHSPGRFRVLGPLSNSNEFAADWKCPSGSKMNPVKKCVVWQ